MKNCGKRFHNEVGKFRFLNELIKVVSPKVSVGLIYASLICLFLVIVSISAVRTNGDRVRLLFVFPIALCFVIVSGLSSSRTREEESTRNDVQLDSRVSRRDQNI